MAHAIHGYAGSCSNIHGHSYELHVTVSAQVPEEDYIASPGFIIDFKELKNLVKTYIVEKLDHKLLLSQAFVKKNRGIKNLENLILWKNEPTAENILLYMKRTIAAILPENVRLIQLRLYETADSYAEWTKND